MQPKQQSLTFKELKVLVVDDDDVLAWSISNEFKSCGAEVLTASCMRTALERFRTFNPDIAITDLQLPEGSGIELLKKWRIENPTLPAILITAHPGIDSAITALRLGAFDYLQKPFNMKDLLAAVARAAEVARLRQNASGYQVLDAAIPNVNIVGDSKAAQDFKFQLLRIARSKADSTLILGESGTGKELAARAIHQWSDRRSEPFVEINCAAIPETLLESELFGYEKGAFTDARERKLGLFEVARGGSVFLDEIGELPLKLQAKLLRVLEYRRFKRLGGTKDICFNGRIIAATNRDLAEESTEKTFRSDLFYRISALPIIIPPLRQRTDDIPILARHFLERLSEDLCLPVPGLGESTIAKLIAYNWPGNVRELRNVLQRAMVFFESNTLEPEHITFNTTGICNKPDTRDYSSIASEFASCAEDSNNSVFGDNTHKAKNQTTTPDSIENNSAPNVNHNIVQGDGNILLPDQGVIFESVEKSFLIQAMEKSHQNQTRAAQMLGITRHTFRYRLEKYGLMTTYDDSGNVTSILQHKCR